MHLGIAFLGNNVSPKEEGMKVQRKVLATTIY